MLLFYIKLLLYMYQLFFIIVSYYDYFGIWLMEVCFFVFLNQIYIIYLQRIVYVLGSDILCLIFLYEGNILVLRGGKNKIINFWELRNIYCIYMYIKDKYGIFRYFICIV